MKVANASTIEAAAVAYVNRSSFIVALRCSLPRGSPGQLGGVGGTGEAGASCPVRRMRLIGTTSHTGQPRMLAGKPERAILSLGASKLSFQVGFVGHDPKT